MPVQIHRVGPDEIALMEAVATTFGEVFDDAETYTGRRPSAAYLRRLLAGESFMAFAALDGSAVVGAIAAYELPKYEQERSELYIYDLAVLATHRRQGVATALIEAVREEAVRRGAWVVFVQADTGVEDAPAIALYSRLGRREEVLHFDIPVPGADAPSDHPPTRSGWDT